MDSEIKRVLERSLPQYVLNFLTEEFRKKEEYKSRVKEAERKVEWLLEELSRKDKMLWEAWKGGNNVGVRFQENGKYPGYTFDLPWGENRQYGNPYPTPYYTPYNPHNPNSVRNRRNRGMYNETGGQEGEETKQDSPLTASPEA